MKHEEFIKNCKKFIVQYDNFVPAENDGLQQSLKILIDRYKKSLENLETTKGKVIEVCSLGEIDARKKEKESKYPVEISKHHIRWARVIGAGVFASIAAYIGSTLGGPNMAIWDPSVTWISLGIGAVPGIGAAVSTYALNKKLFNRDKVRNKEHNKLTKLLDREQRILERVEDKEQALAQLAVQIHTNMDTILSGEFSLKEKRTIKKVSRRVKLRGGIGLNSSEKNITVDAYKEEYENLPKNIQKKLDTVITEYNKEYANLVSIGKDLNNVSTELRKLSKKKRTPIKKVENVVQNEDITLIDSPSNTNDTPTTDVTSTGQAANSEGARR